MNIKLLFSISSLFAFSCLWAQPDQKCKVTVVAEVKDSLFEVVSDQGLISLNYKSGEFMLTIPLSSFDSNIDTLDGFMDASESQLSYTGNIGVDFFEFMNNEENTGKYFPIKGTLTLNNTTKGMLGQYALFKQNNNRDVNDQQIRITFIMDINPTDFGINAYIPALTKPIHIEVLEQPLNRQL
jgi:hypothetical protein